MRMGTLILGLLLAALFWAAPRALFGREGEEKKGPTAAKGESSTEEPKRNELRKTDVTDGEKPIELGKVTVTAEKEKPHYVQNVIPEEEIEEARNSASVDSLFKDQAGVQLTRKSYEGSDSGKLVIRGFGESRSLILLNGRSLHGAGVYGGYYVDWSSLLLEDVERVELIRGAGPAKYGNTLGGVVNIITRQGSEKLRTVIRGLSGSLGTWNAEAAHSWSVGRLRYSLAAGHYETDGYLRNAFVDRNAFATQLSLQLPAELELEVGARYTDGESGMIVYNRPDSPYYDGRKPQSMESPLGGPYVQFWDHGAGSWGPRDWGNGSYWRNERLQFDMGLVRENEEFGFSLQTWLFNESREEHFYAVDNPHHLTLQRNSKPEDMNWGWRADFNNSLESAGRHKIEYGLEGQYLGYGDMNIRKVDPTCFPAWAQPADSPGERNISRLHGGYVQDTWEVNDWLEVEPGIRMDSFVADGPEANAITVDEDEWSPRLALTVRTWEGGHVTGRYARAYRFPTLPEYYWWYGGYQPADRKDLTSEKANQWELEIGHQIADRFEVKARGYSYKVDDYIRTIYGYMPSRVVYNIDRVDFLGLEMEAFYQLPNGFCVWANYTIQTTQKHGDVLDKSSELSDELMELPKNKFGLGLDYRKKNGLEARLALRYVGQRQVLYGNQAVVGASGLKKLDSYVDMDFNLSYPLFRGGKDQEARFILGVQNILNKHYEEEYGFPMPGRTFMAGFNVTF